VRFIKAVWLTLVFPFALSACEGITYQGTGAAYQAPTITGGRTAGSGPFVLVSPQSHVSTTDPITEVLVNKGYVVLPGHTASRLFASGATRQVSSILCADLGTRVKILGTSRVVECAITDINTDEVLYTGKGEHIDWTVDLDFRGAVRAALANLPGTGRLGRRANSSDIALATSSQRGEAPQQVANTQSQRSVGRAPVRSMPPGSGTGFVVSTRGYALTSSRVVEGCGVLRGRLHGRDVALRELATDIDQGLTVLELPPGTYRAAPLAAVVPERRELVVVFGFPAGGSAGASLNVIRGEVVATPSIARPMRVSVDSPMVARGGPALNGEGAVVGLMGEEPGVDSQPAVGVAAIRAFLDRYGVPYENAGPIVSPSATVGSAYTLRISCAS